MSGQARTLIVHADRAALETLRTTAAELSADVYLAGCGRSAEELTRSVRPDLIVMGLALPDAAANETIETDKTDKTRETDETDDLIPRVMSHVPGSQVIVLAAGASVTQAVEVMRQGAFAVLEEPIDREALLATLRHAWRECAGFHDRKPHRATFTAATPIVGQTRALKRTLDTIQRVAPSDANCLIVGESGTGKELMADAIHAASARALGPLIKINCAAIPEELLESELFGHRKGAFTGAIADRQGLFERANGGTLFLDEIAEMPRFLQAKLLRVLQDREIRPLGATQTVPLNLRLICATNVDVAASDGKRTLRDDLFFRINTITLRVPPLRERMDDLAPLCRHFLDKFSERYGRALRGVSEEAMEQMSRYHWPGNIRELENVLERAVIMTKTDDIDVAALPPEIRCPAQPRNGSAPRLMTLDEIERCAVLEALERANWNKQVAASALGIHRPTLYSKMRKYAIDRPRVCSGPA